MKPEDRYRVIVIKLQPHTHPLLFGFVMLKLESWKQNALFLGQLFPFSFHQWGLWKETGKLKARKEHSPCTSHWQVQPQKHQEAPRLDNQQYFLEMGPALSGVSLSCQTASMFLKTEPGLHESSPRFHFCTPSSSMHFPSLAGIRFCCCVPILLS